VIVGKRVAGVDGLTEKFSDSLFWVEPRFYDRLAKS